MLIIVEGPDGAGKSTFAQALEDHLDGEVYHFHRGVPVRHPLWEYVGALKTYTPGAGLGDYFSSARGDADAVVPKTWPHVVCDRWHWGELIYGPRYRKESLLGHEGMRLVDEALAELGAVVAYLTHDYGTLRARVEHRGDDYVAPDDLEALHRRYEQVARVSRLPVMRLCDPTDVDAARVCDVAQTFESLAARRWHS